MSDAAVSTAAAAPGATAPAAADTGTFLSAPADTAPATDASAAPAAGEKTGTAAAAPEGDAAKPGTEAAAAEGKPADDAKPVVEGAPEKYEDFQLPEGADLKVSEEFTTLAKELDLNQGKAQKVVDLGSKIVQRMASAQAETLATAVKGWAAESRADAEFGGQNVAANVAIAEKALQTFGTPELRALLKGTGLAQHPEVIRAFYRAGKAISEDGFVPAGSTNSTNGKSAAQSLYPTMNKPQ
jgi:hypothetical protein